MATELNLPSLENQAEILSALQHMVVLKTAELSSAIDPDTLTMAQIQQIVRTGYASKVFQIGQKVVTTYTYSGTEYECPFYIVAFEDVELEDGETVPGMVLQMAYASIESLPFDSYHFFYVAEEELEAGTYNIISNVTSGSSLVSGATYQFTLTEAVPAGGGLTGFHAGSDMYIYSYESTTAETYIEKVTATEGDEGTYLLALDSAPNADEPHASSTASLYGLNQWSQSCYRQWLNSDAAAGSWFTPVDEYNLRPSALFSYAGFMAGFESDFLSCLGKIAVNTATNLSYLDGSTETTYDTFFLPSLEQIYVTPQISGVEGDYWPYWKRALGLSSTEAQYSTNADRITYLLSNHSSSQYVWLRSAHRGTAGTVWYVYSSGYVGNHNAYSSRHCAPACVIV